MKVFDYIIIGAGSAGCVLANRLSENPNNTVLLLEAGGKPTNKFIDIPLGYSNLHRSEVDWGFSTEQQKHIDNKRIYLPRGKTLGGCSSTNAMAYVRGNKADYDEWAALGNKGWSYDEVLPYFKKSEVNENFRNDYHGSEGLLNVCNASYKTPFAEAFLKGCEQNGIPIVKDYNGETQEGANYFQFTIKKGARHSTAKAFLVPFLNRKNLTVITEALVQKVLIKDEKATGVVYVKNGQEQQVKATKEVVISAGAFQSPQLLMLSGIGDKNELQQHNIEVKKHIPGVGKNLQDHLVAVTSSLSTTQEGFNHLGKPFSGLMSLVKYLFTKSGPMSSSVIEATAFFHTDKSEGVNFQLHFSPLHLGNDDKADLYNPKTITKEDGFSILPTLLKPKSRGYVALQSNKVEDAPIIQPNFFSEEEDLQVMLKGLKKSIEIIQSKAFEPHTKSYLLPKEMSDESLIAHIKECVETLYHPVGTCKMGNDAMAVVNDELQVKGIKNLRVVDASIMPTIVAGNTNAPVIMIAEKAADLILKTNKEG